MANIDSLGIFILGLDVIGWIVMLSGVATTTADYEPDYLIGLWWWAVWFQFVTLMLVTWSALAAASEGWCQLRRDFLTMVSVLEMVTTQSAIELSKGARDKTHDGARTSQAGFIICCILNFFLLIYFALDVGSTEWRAGPAMNAKQQGQPHATPVPEPARQFPIQMT